MKEFVISACLLLVGAFLIDTYNGLADIAGWLMIIASMLISLRLYWETSNYGCQRNSD